MYYFEIGVQADPFQPTHLAPFIVENIANERA